MDASDAILRMGLYQLAFMDSIPSYAVTTVSLAALLQAEVVAPYLIPENKDEFRYIPGDRQAAYRYQVLLCPWIKDVA